MPTLKELAERAKERKKKFSVDSEKEVLVIPKTDATAIVVRRLVRNGQDQIDIRTYYFNKNRQEFEPTKKGVMLTLEQAKQIIDVLKEEGVG